MTNDASECEVLDDKDLLIEDLRDDLDDANQEIADLRKELEEARAQHSQVQEIANRAVELFQRQAQKVEALKGTLAGCLSELFK
jgi:chromosome segregation ATPase